MDVCENGCPSFFHICFTEPMITDQPVDWTCESKNRGFSETTTWLFNIARLPIKNGVFSMAMLNYQRVTDFVSLRLTQLLLHFFEGHMIVSYCIIFLFSFQLFVSVDQATGGICVGINLVMYGFIHYIANFMLVCKRDGAFLFSMNVGFNFLGKLGHTYP